MNRLVYDLCTPTAERRPTTLADLENDINVKNFNSPEELYDELLDITNYDDEEVIDICESADLLDKVNWLLDSCYYDPGDGSPNIFYCAINNQELDPVGPYNCLEYLDLRTCSKEDIIKACLEDIDDIITLDDCIEYCDNNKNAATILYNWLVDTEVLDYPKDYILDLDYIQDLIDSVDDREEARIVANALNLNIEDLDDDSDYWYEDDEDIEEDSDPLYESYTYRKMPKNNINNWYTGSWIDRI